MQTSEQLQRAIDAQSTPEKYLAWLRHEWKADGAVKAKLLTGARAWARDRRWLWRFPQASPNGKVVLSVITTLIDKGLV